MATNQAPTRRKQALKDELYQDVMALRSLFFSLQLDHAEADKWRIMNDYLDHARAGCPTRGMIAKVREFLLQFGPRSIFYRIHQTTKRERNQYTQRIFYICREIQKLKDERWPNLSRVDVRTLGLFRKNAIGMVRWLKARPLTHAQKEHVWGTEHMLGIWWLDLSDEDNGMRLKRKGSENG